jgi:dolichol kinase
MPSTLVHELARKSIHMGSAVVPVAYAAGLPRRVLLVGLAALLAVALVVEVARFRSPRARVWFARVVGALLREHEHDRWSGATWMLASYLLATLLFPRAVAVAAMLAVALGDASAAVVGRWAAGRRPAQPATHAVVRRKTWAGSAACAVVTAAGALWIAGLGPAASVAAALAAAAAERPAVAIDDNVRVALASGRRGSSRGASRGPRAARRPFRPDKRAGSTPASAAYLLTKQRGVPI